MLGRGVQKSQRSLQQLASLLQTRSLAEAALNDAPVSSSLQHQVDHSGLGNRNSELPAEKSLLLQLTRAK